MYSTTSTCDQFFVKTEIKGLKRQLSSKITEILLNDISKWHHISDTWNGMQKLFLSKYFSYHIQKLQL